MHFLILPSYQRSRGCSTLLLAPPAVFDMGRRFLSTLMLKTRGITPVAVLCKSAFERKALSVPARSTYCSGSRAKTCDGTGGGRHFFLTGRPAATRRPRPA